LWAEKALKPTTNWPAGGRAENYHRKWKFVVPSLGESSNLIFETLADWNRILQHTSLGKARRVDGDIESQNNRPQSRTVRAKGKNVRASKLRG
jgi:hypothetical protein